MLLEPAGAPVPLESHAQMVGPHLHAEFIGKISTDVFC